MRLPLIPRENKFFHMFVRDAANAVAAARVLEQFMRNYDDRERLASQLPDAEHEGDLIATTSATSWSRRSSRPSTARTSTG